MRSRWNLRRDDFRGAPRSPRPHSEISPAAPKLSEIAASSFHFALFPAPLVHTRSSLRRRLEFVAEAGLGRRSEPRQVHRTGE
jgi:hypothetical protein